METEAPKGLGLYLRYVKLSTVAERAKEMKDHGLTWAVIAGPWHDRSGERWINKPYRVQQIAEILANAGIDPHIWGYPWHDRIDLFIEQMIECTSELIVGWLLDPELGLKGHLEAAKLLFRKAREHNPFMLIGLTSYGLPMLHHTFPFAAFARSGHRGDILVECDYGSPQLYDVPEAQVKRGVQGYHDIGFDHVVPSFGLYKYVRRDPDVAISRENRKAVSKTAEELDRHLSHFFNTGVKVPGLVGWAENFIAPEHWHVLAIWAETLKRVQT